jgi:RHS repeat-associated protein
LDYFLARYYSSAQGRFTSIDPYNPISQSKDADDFKTFLNQPQSWNRYPYTINNPLIYVDPDGERWFYKVENGNLTDIQWVDPNDDGTYTSPGEGYQEFIPTKEKPSLVIMNGQKTVRYYLGETAEGGPEVKGYAMGTVQDHTMELVVEYLIFKGTGKLIEGGIGVVAGISARALQAWRAYRTARAIKAIETIFSDATKLAGKTPAEVEAGIGEVPSNWAVETLGKGSQKGNGWVLREYGANGQPTGRMIQWHPGGGHHGAAPYWKVSSGTTGTVRIGPQFK